VVVDCDPLGLSWLERSLKQAGVAVIARSASPEHGLALAQEHCPDLLVIGSEQPVDETPLLDELVALRRSLPELRTVVVSGSCRRSTIAAAFDAGVNAYCLRSAEPDDLVVAIRQAFDRSLFLPLPATHSSGSTSSRHTASSGELALTRREREILALVSEGRSNREVARLLWLTEQTVKFHLHNVYRKLDVPNRIEAARWAHCHALPDAQSVRDYPVLPTRVRPVEHLPTSVPRRPAHREFPRPPRHRSVSRWRGL